MGIPLRDPTPSAPISPASVKWGLFHWIPDFSFLSKSLGDPAGGTSKTLGARPAPWGVSLQASEPTLGSHLRARGHSHGTYRRGMRLGRLLAVTGVEQVLSR